MKRHPLLAVAALLLATASHAAPPTVSHLFPGGGQRGTRVTVTATGTFGWPVQVHAPGVDVAVGKDKGKLEITIPKDLAADRVWIRLYDREGAAKRMPFLIDNLPEIEEKEPNDRPRDAQALPEAKVVVNGILAKPGDVDCFALPLKAGQTLVAAVAANSGLGSPMDAVLQVVTPDGSVVAENNDDVHLDPRLAYTAPRDGTYVVRLFAFPEMATSAIGFSSGANYVYRLTLTAGPYIAYAQSLAVPQAQPGTVEVRGWNLPAGMKLPVVPLGAGKLGEAMEHDANPELRLPADAAVGFVYAADVAGGARVRLTKDTVLPGITTSDPAKPALLPVPGMLTGWLASPKQQDTFRVPLKKGEQVIVAVEANTLNLPVEPLLRWLDPAGAVLKESTDTETTHDTLQIQTASRDGDYQIRIRDRYRHGGERYLYRLSVRRDEPDFELTAAEDAVTVAGKETELTIKVVRRGKIGPITIEAVGLPPGVVAKPVVSELKGDSAGSVKLKLSSTGPAFSGPLRIVGKASEPRAIERSVRTTPRLGVAFERLWLTVAESKK